MNHIDLFSGIGGFALAGSWVCGEDHNILTFCEKNPFCQKVLKKHWPDVPIHDDVTTFKKYYDNVDLITCGFPCQDISHCGKQEGIEGERSGLWKEYLRVLGEIRPKYGIVENTANLLAGDDGRWFGVILKDLAGIGYDAEWYSLQASYFGFVHHRKRVFIITYPNGSMLEGMDIPKSIRAYKKKPCRRELTRTIDACLQADDYARMRGNYDGVPEIMDRLKALGNAIVPQVVVPIMQAIKEIEGE